MRVRLISLTFYRRVYVETMNNIVIDMLFLVTLFLFSVILYLMIFSFFHNILHIYPIYIFSFPFWAAGKEIISALPTEQLTNENHPYAGFLLIINHEDVTIKLFAHTLVQHHPNCFHMGFIDHKSFRHHNRTIHAHFIFIFFLCMCCLGACRCLAP